MSIKVLDVIIWQLVTAVVWCTLGFMIGVDIVTTLHEPVMEYVEHSVTVVSTVRGWGW